MTDSISASRVAISSAISHLTIVLESMRMAQKESRSARRFQSLLSSSRGIENLRIPPEVYRSSRNVFQARNACQDRVESMEHFIHFDGKDTLLFHDNARL
jgi:hypothetical protein